MRILNIYLIIILFVQLFLSCQTFTGNRKEKAKEEIEQTEREFLKMSLDKGISVAFSFYADTNAVVKSDDSLIKGKSAVSKFYASPYFKNTSFIWSADFVEASEDGNLGYTYGKYIFQTRDTAGKESDFKGIFHTVWKKQPDGSWKYVWD
jgi:ketosteroid isomerase-like protein